MSKSLYDLNKDELICLISTIEERTKAEAIKNYFKFAEEKDQKHWDELVDIFHTYPDLFHEVKCELCDKAEYIRIFDGYIYHYNSSTTQCETCFKNYCKDHEHHLERKWDSYWECKNH